MFLPSTLDQILTNQSGILLIDKPTGPTSHDLVNWLRRVTRIRRIGHTGTLDPLASGLMIMLVGRESTKLQDLFLKQDKSYLVTGQLGMTSDTYDITGNVLTHNDNWRKLTKAKLLEVIEQFRGEISQTAPIYSAIKVGGQKLCDMARRAAAPRHSLINLHLPIRQITIYNIILTDYSLPHFSLEVSCSSGTYIRSLIHDIGQILGSGAVVTALRRNKIGDLSINQASVCPNYQKLFNLK